MAKLIFLHLLSASFCLVIRLLNCHSIQRCSQTPHPEICNSLITTHNLHITGKTQVGFRDSAIRATLDQAMAVHRLLSTVDAKSLDGQAKLAWSDCMELSEHTISKLNQSVLSLNPASVDDVQTWLSAAAANHETCQDGFAELNNTSSSSHLPVSLLFTSANFSKLLSNSLAINNAATSSQKLGSGRRLLSDDGLPNWVPTAERNLLETSDMALISDVVVAKDGRGNYTTISDAVDSISKLRRSNKRFVIRVKAGAYQENIVIKRKLKNIMFIGDGIDQTIVTGNRSVYDGWTTFRSATFAVTGDGFIAQNMTFENTAGPEKHQAVALRSGSDRSIFYRCSFKGYQDTLYVHSQRQFYRDCDIYGTVDFILGDAAAVLQNCTVYVRRPLINQKNTITAQSRSRPHENTGIIVHYSRVLPAEDLWPVRHSFETYLGRPWKAYSRTIFMKTFISSVVDSSGWLEWDGDFGLSSLYYGEYMNMGVGANTSGRVTWPGYHVITTPVVAGKFSSRRFLKGDRWIPATGVPFFPGL